MSKVIKMSNSSAYSLLQVLRSVNDLQLIGSFSPDVNARRGAHLLNVLEEEVYKALDKYASDLDQIIKNANDSIKTDLDKIPADERLATNPVVAALQRQVNEEIDKNALILGLTLKASESCEINIESDDRAKFLNAALDKLAGSWNNRKAYLAVCDAVDAALK